MHLFGQTPETALLSALAAIEFYNNQLQMSLPVGSHELSEHGCQNVDWRVLASCFKFETTSKACSRGVFTKT